VFYQTYILAILLTFLAMPHAFSNQENQKTRTCFPGFDSSQSALDPDYRWFFNTSNQRKRSILTKFTKQHDISWLDNDLQEIDADDISIVVHKASRFNEEGKRVIVEDSALYVDGADVGTNVRWLNSKLPQLVGRKAVWVSLLAYRDGDAVKVFRAETHGVMTHKKSEIGGIEDYFEPHQDAPYKRPNTESMINLLLGNIHATREPITEWYGEWQNEN